MPAALRRVAVCVDASPAARRALDEAVRLREAAGARLAVLHVATAPALVGYSRWGPEHQAFYAEAEEWLGRLMAEVPGRADPVLLWGHPASAACDWAAREGCDLLVAATHAGNLRRNLLGSFAAHLAHHAPCAVLLVPPGVAPAPAAPGPPPELARDVAAAVDEEGTIYADGDWPAAPGEGWEPVHLALAALAREAVDALEAAAAREGLQAWGRATASASMAAGHIGEVRIGVHAQVDPAPGRAVLRQLVAAATAASVLAGALAAPPRWSWTVNDLLVPPDHP